MSLRLEIAEQAEGNILSQYEWYCENANEEVASQYLGAVRETIYRLKTHPGLGSFRKFRRRSLAGIRAVNVDSPYDVHLVFYRHDETTLTVEYVIHGARDLSKHLRESEVVYGAAQASTERALA